MAIPYRRLTTAVLAAGAAWSALALCLDVLGHDAPPHSPVDAVVVAGCRVDPGGVPSDCLAARTDRGIELYTAGVAPLLVFTGGVGDHPPSEAEVSAARARAAGIPEAHIRIENRSASTWENARFAAELEAVERIVVVSDAWHTHRVQRVFAHHFDEVHTVGVDSPLQYRLFGAHREVLAVVYYALRGRL